MVAVTSQMPFIPSGMAMWFMWHKSSQVLVDVISISDHRVDSNNAK